ncbi:Type 1 glutamine amidotransferase-like domain-containing protein [Planococcus dechangensis]|uniref:Type 1 glutamine amidotransferase-like domain-containing protein n=1 Tax=Planococcus dechangensis TaxID=1176255 RepID=A0ABV9MG32_9BACL
MKTHYYLGWFNNYFPEKLIRALQEDITERKSLVMISSNPSLDDVDGAAERSWLEQAGIRFDDYHLINYRVQRGDADTLIQTASVIFLLGGDTIKQNRFLKDYELLEPIKKSTALILGASAGAINMSAKWLCSKNFGHHVDTSSVYDGIALNNFSVLSHFDLENNMALVQSELSTLSEEMTVYVSNKDCALRVSEDKIDILGDVYVVSRSEIKKMDETF